MCRSRCISPRLLTSFSSYLHLRGGKIRTKKRERKCVTPPLEPNNFWGRMGERGCKVNFIKDAESVGKFRLLMSQSVIRCTSGLGRAPKIGEMGAKEERVSLILKETSGPKECRDYPQSQRKANNCERDCNKLCRKKKIFVRKSPPSRLPAAVSLLSLSHRFLRLCFAPPQLLPLARAYPALTPDISRRIYAERILSRTCCLGLNPKIPSWGWVDTVAQ